MERIIVENTNTGIRVNADVLSRSDKRIRVVIDGMSDPVNFTRTDVRKPYICKMAGIELQSKG